MSKLVVNTIEAQTYKYDSDTTAMTFNSDGSILRPNLIAFRAAGNNANYIATSPAPFPTVTYNYGNGYDNTTYTFTAPIAGLYEFTAHFGILKVSSAGGSGYPRFRTNQGGVDADGIYAYFHAPTSTAYTAATLHDTYAFAANDTVKIIFPSMTNFTYYNGPSESSFSGRLIG
jgi:hypothetical protein